MLGLGIQLGQMKRFYAMPEYLVPMIEKINYFWSVNNHASNSILKSHSIATANSLALP